jgi:TatD DNase family protein
VKLIDTHAHLDFPEFDKSRADVIARAEKAGVGIINCLLDPKGLPKTEKFKEIRFTIGCCPYRFDEYERQWKMLQEHVDKAIAVGEIGLDYYWVKDQQGRDREKENFLRLLKFAREHGKPVLIHSRNAEKQALDILEKERVEKAIMHCFSGTMEDAKRAIDLGYPISIPTNVVLSKQKQDFAQKLPLESLVLETDSPYLSPERGKLNEPANVAISARKIADLRKIGFDEVCSVTTKTARGFFKI